MNRSQKETCSFRPSEVGATCTGFVQVSAGDELALKKAVASVGPITVCIDASQPSFQLYKGGVYDEQSCNPIVFDHAVLIVGYGVYQGKDYWLVKNRQVFKVLTYRLYHTKRDGSVH